MPSLSTLNLYTANIHASGELALLWATLKRAILDAAGLANLSSRSENKVAANRAKRWLYLWEQSDCKKEFTFPWICEHLDICPHNTTKLIREQLAKGIPGNDGNNRNKFRTYDFFYDRPETPTLAEVYFL